MTLPRNAQYLRYGAELVVVFLGVFLGLLAENYREFRRERADELVSLARIVSDLEFDREDMTGNLERTRVSHEAARWIMDRADTEGVEPDSIAYYLGRLQHTSVLNTNTSEYSALVGAGRLNIIQDSDFLERLTQLYESYPWIGGLHAADRQYLNNAMERIAPYVRVVWVSEVGLIQIRLVGDPDAILSESRFLLGVSMMIGRRNILEDQYRQMLDEIEVLQGRARAYVESGEVGG